LFRILSVDASGLWLAQQGVTTFRPWPAELPRSVRPGDVVELRHDRATLASPCTSTQFPHPDGDFHRIIDRGGLRYQAVLDRAVLLRAIRRFFDRRGFIEVDPPVMARSPGLELHLDAVRVQLRQGMGGELVERFLVTSPEYHMKRLLSAGFEKIYSLGHAFRSGERGAHHNPEFAMLEWYRAGEGYLSLVRDARGLMRDCAAAIARGRVEVDRPPPPNRLDPRSPWLRLSIRQALQRFAGFDPGRGDDDALVRQRARQAGLQIDDDETADEVVVRALVERVEPRLADVPAVVLDRWPASMASLARRFDDRPWLAQRFEIYVQGIELANGFTELVDPVEQRARFELDLAARRRAGLPEYPVDQRFLSALAEGCPPAAGVALGVDRLLMALGGYGDIDEVLAFPFERA
jgi:lysyl-tRNA synthetase class 2